MSKNLEDLSSLCRFLDPGKMACLTSELTWYMQSSWSTWSRMTLQTSFSHFDGCSLISSESLSLTIFVYCGRLDLNTCSILVFLHVPQSIWSNHMTDRFEIFICLAILELNKTTIIEQQLGFDEILRVNSLSPTPSLTCNSLSTSYPARWTLVRSLVRLKSFAIA